MTDTTKPTITADMTMAQILEAFPAAQRALFQRYHVGGCSSCAFQPTDTLTQVCKDHNILDVNEVIAHLSRAQELDDQIQVHVTDVKSWLDAGEDFSFIDVRGADEIAMAKIDAAEALDFANSDKYMALPKDRKIVFSCKSGARSLDVASYFIGHGFTNVFSMRGGIDAWRAEIDPAIPAY